MIFNEFKNAFQRTNHAHVQLIVINVAVFLCLLLLDFITWAVGIEPVFDIIYKQFSIPSVLSEFFTRPWTLVTYAFAHSMSDVFHILINMLVFYWFGKLFIEYLGSDKLVALYVLGGLAGALAFLVIYNLNIETFGSAEMVGASAAVYAVVVATAVLLPDYTFFLFLLGPVRIKYIALFYILVSMISVRHGVNFGGNIAHLGGAFMGFVYMKQLQAGFNWGAWITATLDWVKDLFSSRPKVKVTYRKEETNGKKKASKIMGDRSKISQEEIDAILDKISDGGYESLTKDEKEKLFNASKK